MGYNHNLYIWFSDVSNTGFTVNGKFQAGQNSYNANGFNAYTSVDGVGTNNHTIKISSRGGSATFSNYYNVGTNGFNARTYTCRVGADTSWSSNGCDSGNPVSATVTVPKRDYEAFGTPGLSLSSTSITYKNSVTVSWSKASTQGNANFDHFELYLGSTKIYSGSGTSMTVCPYDYIGSTGGTATFKIVEVHEWYGTYPTQSTSKSVTCRAQYIAHSNPTIKAAKTTCNYGESVTLSWAKSSTQGNANFNRFELYLGSTKIYSGSAVSYAVTPSSVTGAKGGTATYTLKEIHEWYGTYYTTSASVSITVRSGVVTAYDSSGAKHTGLVTAYDSSGKGHYVLITGYDSNGSPHSVV